MNEPTDSQLMPTQLPVKVPDVGPSTSLVAPEPGILPGSPRDLIYRAYIEGDGKEGPLELADRFNRPLLEVLHWFKEGGWVKQRRELVAAAKEHQDQSYREVIVNQRLRTVLKQLATGEELEKLVDRVIEDAKNGTLTNSVGVPARLSPGMLKTLAEAASIAASLRAKAVGLTEKVAADASAAAAAEAPQQRMGLLVIGAAPVGPAPKAPIDITSEVHNITGRQ
jgi:hypothetical protein